MRMRASRRLPVKCSSPESCGELLILRWADVLIGFRARVVSCTSRAVLQIRQLRGLRAREKYLRNAIYNP